MIAFPIVYAYWQDRESAAGVLRITTSSLIDGFGVDRMFIFFLHSWRMDWFNKLGSHLQCLRKWNKRKMWEHVIWNALSIRLRLSSLSYYSKLVTPRRPGFAPGQSMWDLWWTKWHWDMFFSEFFGIPLTISFQPTIIFSWGWTIGTLKVAVQRYIDMNNNNFTTSVNSPHWTLICLNSVKVSLPHFSLLQSV
jgi:hypothetical protein